MAPKRIFDGPRARNKRRRLPYDPLQPLPDPLPVDSFYSGTSETETDTTQPLQAFRFRPPLPKSRGMQTSPPLLPLPTSRSIQTSPSLGPTVAQLQQAHTETQRLADQLREMEARIRTEREQRELIMHQTEAYVQHTDAEHNQTILQTMRQMQQLAGNLHDAVDRESRLKAEAKGWLDHLNQQIRDLQTEQQRLQLENERIPLYQQEMAKLTSTILSMEQECLRYQQDMEETFRKMDADHTERLRQATTSPPSRSQSANANTQTDVATSSTTGRSGTTTSADTQTDLQLQRMEKQITETQAQLVKERAELDAATELIERLLRQRGQDYLAENDAAWKKWLDEHGALMERYGSIVRDGGVSRDTQTLATGLPVDPDAAPNLDEIIGVWEQLVERNTRTQADLVRQMEDAQTMRDEQRTLTNQMYEHVRGLYEDLALEDLGRIQEGFWSSDALKQARDALSRYETEMAHLHGVLEIQNEETELRELFYRLRDVENTQKRHMAELRAQAVRLGLEESDAQIHRLQDELNAANFELTDLRQRLLAREDDLLEARHQWGIRDSYDRGLLEDTEREVRQEMLGQLDRDGEELLRREREERQWFLQRMLLGKLNLLDDEEKVDRMEIEEETNNFQRTVTSGMEQAARYGIEREEHVTAEAVGRDLLAGTRTAEAEFEAAQFRSWLQHTKEAIRQAMRAQTNGTLTPDDEERMLQGVFGEFESPGTATTAVPTVPLTETWREKLWEVETTEQAARDVLSTHADRVRKQIMRERDQPPAPKPNADVPMDTDASPGVPEPTGLQQAAVRDLFAQNRTQRKPKPVAKPRSDRATLHRERNLRFTHDLSLAPDKPYIGPLVPLRDRNQLWGSTYVSKENNQSNDASRDMRSRIRDQLATPGHAVRSNVSSEEMERLQIAPGVVEQKDINLFAGAVDPRTGKGRAGRPTKTVVTESGLIVPAGGTLHARRHYTITDNQDLDDDDVVVFTLAKSLPGEKTIRPMTTTWGHLRTRLNDQYKHMYQKELIRRVTNPNNALKPVTFTPDTGHPHATIKAFIPIRGMRWTEALDEKRNEAGYITIETAKHLQRLYQVIYPAETAARRQLHLADRGGVDRMASNWDERRRERSKKMEERKASIQARYEERLREIQAQAKAEREKEAERRRLTEEREKELADLENIDLYLPDSDEEVETSIPAAPIPAPFPPVDVPSSNRNVAVEERVRTPSPVRQQEQTALQTLAMEIGLEAESGSSGSSSVSGKGKERQRGPTALGVPIGDPSRNIFLRTGPDGIPGPLPEEGVVMGTRLPSPPASPPSLIPAAKPAPKPAPKIDEAHRRRIAVERGREWGGGGEAPVGELPRDILNVPDNQQRIFRDLRGAYVAAGIHGRMAQVRPPPPPPEATEEDESDDENQSNKGDREPRNWADYYSAGHAVELVQSIQPAQDATAEERQRMEQYRSIMMGSMVQRGLEQAKKSGVPHTNRRL